MYNMVFGTPNSGKVRTMLLVLDDLDVGRFRDLFIETTDVPGQYVLAVYTRNGGGNRPDYERQIEAMRAHPLYLSDADDNFDETYATFRFRFDPIATWDAAVEQGRMSDGEGNIEARERFVELMELVATPPVDTDERWKEAIRGIGGNVDE